MPPAPATPDPARLGPDGARSYMHFPAAVERPAHAHAPALPGHLSWDTAPLKEPLEITGPPALELLPVTEGSA